MKKSPLKPGEVIGGRYRVEGVIGMGSMGAVMSATDVRDGDRVAIKVLLERWSTDEARRERFLREIRICLRLRSKHIVRVWAGGFLDSGAPYMVMERLEGRDLAALLKMQRQMPVPQAVELLLQACEAVSEAHMAGIVHRDLKPGNLFLATGRDRAPCVKVLDFGISKLVHDAVALTDDKARLGSPPYMAPEQWQPDKTISARTDIWALGVMLYEMLAGTTPFHSGTIAGLCANVLVKPPTPIANHRLGVPAGLESIVLQCLEKAPERRFPDVAQLAAALVPFAPAKAASSAMRAATVLGVEAVPSRRTALLPDSPQSGYRRWGSAALVAVALGAAGVGTSLGIVRVMRLVADRPSPSRDTMASAATAPASVTPPPAMTGTKSAAPTSAMPARSARPVPPRTPRSGTPGVARRPSGP